MLPFLKRKARLLVLDDDPSMQRLVGTLLKRAGHRVDIVSEASQAIAHLGRSNYDGLLLDIMTPTEGGITVIKHLRKSRPELLRRVVLLTGAPESGLKAVAAEVFAVVKKPFDAAVLIETVGRVIAQ
jgi:two-component system response regulator GlrR